jgi:hypothetical protein
MGKQSAPCGKGRNWKILAAAALLPETSVRDQAAAIASEKGISAQERGTKA